jgi:hypothetical protein
MELNMRIRVLTLPAAFILAVPLIASTIYTYTGNDFTSATAPYTTSDSVTGSFTVASPLADNLDGANLLAGCVSDCTTPFSFSDGDGNTITNTTPGIGDCACSPYIDIWTDGSGNIINWVVDLTVGELGGFSIYTQDYYAGIFSGYVIQDVVSTYEVSDIASNSGDAGTWSASTTSAAPEPGSLGLLGAGLVALTVLAVGVRR